MPDLYERWSRLVLDQLRSPVLAREAEYAQQIQELQQRLSRLRQPSLAEQEVRSRERQLEELAAETGTLEVEIRRHEAELRRELDALLAQGRELLQAASAACDQELLVEAGKLLDMPELLGELAPVVLLSRLREHARPEQLRRQLRSAALEARARVQAQADLRGERDRLTAQLNDSRQAFTQLLAELEQRHEVRPEVLAALETMVAGGTDEAFLEHLSGQAADARTEAAWRLPANVFAELGLPPVEEEA
jgi:hypothetical protein